MTKSRGILAPRRRFTEFEVAYLRANFPTTQTQAIAAELGRDEGSVNRKAYALGLHKSAEYLASPAACRLRRGDNVGAAFRFKKGLVPANKGTRRPGYAPGRMASTQFRKGERRGASARNWLPIGSVRVNADGYLDRKVRDDGPPQNRWRAVHRLVWEEANGAIPPDCAIVFKGPRTTVEAEITVDRLELVTRAELGRRNCIHNNYPKELVRLVQLRGALVRQINKRTKREDEDHRPA